MSLADLTRNSYQSGVPGTKWVSLCRLFISQNHPKEGPDVIGTAISNSVLLLLPTYPAEPALHEYLKLAIQSELLPLSTYVTTFLQAVQSPELQNLANLDMLCRTALDAHYASRMPVYGSMVQAGLPPAIVLATIHDALSLLRIVLALPIHIHSVVTSSSELLVMLLSCLSVLDMSQTSTTQVMLTYTDATDLLQSPRLTPEMRQVLDDFVLALSLVIGDNSKAASEAQMVQTMQLALGKGDISEPLPDTDHVTCSLLLQYLVAQRGGKYGSGNDTHAAVVLSAFFRWSSWTPAVFFRQLLIAACLCISQHPISTKPEVHQHELWRAFVVGRLPSILIHFERVNPNFSSEWRASWQAATISLFQHTQLLNSCNQDTSNQGISNQPDTTYFSRPLLAQLVSLGLLDKQSALNLDPLLLTQDWAKIRKEAQAIGVDIKDYLEAKLTFDGTRSDVELLLRTIVSDFDAQEAFARAFSSRVQTFIMSHDWEQLSQLVQLLLSNDLVLDILALHLRLDDLMQSLAIWDQVDLEVVGDPQTTVSQVGHIVLFVSSTIARYKLSLPPSVFPFHHEDAGSYMRSFDLNAGEERTTFMTWQKALFDPSSEGIEDSIFRSTRPMTILRITPILVSEAMRAVIMSKMDKTALDGGVSYFLEPLLNWTLVGVIKATLYQYQKSNFRSPIHYHVLNTLLLAESTPITVLRLCAPSILRIISESAVKKVMPHSSINLVPLRKRALHILGLSDIVAPDGPPPPAPSDSASGPQSRPVPVTTIPLEAPLPWDEQPAHAIHTALADAHAARAPMLDLARCLRIAPPTRVIHTLWTECLVTASVGGLPIARQLATFVLCTPGTGPPLLPLFLFLVLPQLLISIEQQPPHEQAVSIELLVAILSSSLTAALHLEMISGSEGENHMAGADITISFSAKLARDLRGKEKKSSVIRMILQRLASMHAFSSHFPMFLKST